MKQDKFSVKVYGVVKKIPKGKVATYGQIAKLCGSPKAYRAIGNILHKNPDQDIIPCHRVVNRKGQLSQNFAFGGIEGQKYLLEVENIFINEKYQVDLSKYSWETNY